MVTIKASTIDSVNNFTLDGKEYLKKDYKTYYEDFETSQSGSIQVLTYIGIVGSNSNIAPLVYVQSPKRYSSDGVTGFTDYATASAYLENLLAEPTNTGVGTSTADAVSTSGTPTNFTNSTNDVQGAIDGIDTALGLVSFGDSSFPAEIIPFDVAVTDYSTTIQNAVDNNKYVILDNAKTYPISTRIEIPSGVRIDLNGSTVTSSTIDEIFNLLGDARISNGNITSSLVRSTESFFGLVMSINKASDLILLENLHFEVPNSNINAIKVDNSTNGVATKNLVVMNCTGDGIGRMFLEAISHNNKIDDDLNYIGNVYLINPVVNDTGTQGDYGMVYSGSGNVRNSYVENVVANSAMDIFLEDSGTHNYVVNGGRLSNPKNATDRFFGVFTNTNHSSLEEQHMKSSFSNLTF